MGERLERERAIRTRERGVEGGVLGSGRALGGGGERVPGSGRVRGRSSRGWADSVGGILGGRGAEGVVPGLPVAGLPGAGRLRRAGYSASGYTGFPGLGWREGRGSRGRGAEGGVPEGGRPREAGSSGASGRAGYPGCGHGG